MDNKGYVLGGVAFLLIIPALILSNILISVFVMDETQVIPFKTDKIHQLSGDVESNIPIFTLQVLSETSEGTSITGEPVSNSRSIINTGIQKKVDSVYRGYQKETGIIMHCKITSVDNSRDPYKICVNYTLYADYNDSHLVKNMSQDVPFSCSDFPDSSVGSYKIKDPLPFVKTRGYGHLKINGDKLGYGTTLSNYLKSKGINNSATYENASSPLYIKRCPYDPYNSHGHSKSFLTLKNCIDNGYYHVSSAGSCIFCRLEGKSVCSHMGLETFVVPGTPKLQCDTAPCSVDHVIFGSTPTEIYPGKLLEYTNNNSLSFWIYLDNGHRDKYGLPKD